MSLIRPTFNNQTSAPLGAFGTDRGVGHSPRFHQGHDFPTPVGTPIFGSGDGGIVSSVINTGRTSGHGLSVLVTYPGGVQVRASHMSAVDVIQGTRVGPTTRLGLSGGAKGAAGAGGSAGPHVHTEVAVNGVRVDPFRYLAPRPTSGTAGGTPTPISSEEDDMYDAAARQELIGDRLDKTLIPAIARIEQAVDRNDRGEILNLSSTNDGKVGTGMQYFRSPGRGIVYIPSPDHAKLLDRYTRDAPGERFFPAEIAVINTYLVGTIDPAPLVAAVQAALKGVMVDVDEDVITSGILAGLQGEFDKVNANIDDQPTEFSLTPR